MRFVKSFKGYEDKVSQLDKQVNTWTTANKINIVNVRTCLSHEQGSRAGSGDLIYTVIYEADQPIP